MKKKDKGLYVACKDFAQFLTLFLKLSIWIQIYPKDKTNNLDSSDLPANQL